MFDSGLSGNSDLAGDVTFLIIDQGLGGKFQCPVLYHNYYLFSTHTICTPPIEASTECLVDVLECIHVHGIISSTINHWPGL